MFVVSARDKSSTTDREIGHTAMQKKLCLTAVHIPPVMPDAIARCIFYFLYSAFFFPLDSSSPNASHNMQKSKNAAEADIAEE